MGSSVSGIFWVPPKSWSLGYSLSAHSVLICLHALVSQYYMYIDATQPPAIASLFPQASTVKNQNAKIKSKRAAIQNCPSDLP